MDQLARQRWDQIMAILSDRTPEYLERCAALEKLCNEQMADILAQGKAYQKRTRSRGCGGIIDLKKLQDKLHLASTDAPQTIGNLLGFNEDK